MKSHIELTNQSARFVINELWEEILELEKKYVGDDTNVPAESEVNENG